MALAVGLGGARSSLPLCTLQLCEHDGAYHGALSRVPGSRAGGWRTSTPGGAAAGVLLQPECRNHALRHGVGAGLLRSRVCHAGGLVAHRFSDLRCQSGYLDGSGDLVVEVDWTVVGSCAQARPVLPWIRDLVMTKATVSPTGRIVIPKKVRERLNLKAGTQVTIDVQGDTLVMKRLATSLPDWRTMEGMARGGESLTE